SRSATRRTCGPILSPRELPDVLQVQSDVSAAIARQILATLPLPHNLRHRSAGAPCTPLRRRSPSPATPTIRANLLGETDTICAAALPISRKPSARIHPSPKPTRVSLGRRRFGQVPNDGMPPAEAKP